MLYYHIHVFPFFIIVIEMVLVNVDVNILSSYSHILQIITCNFNRKQRPLLSPFVVATFFLIRYIQFSKYKHRSSKYSIVMSSEWVTDTGCDTDCVSRKGCVYAYLLDDCITTFWGIPTLT